MAFSRDIDLIEENVRPAGDQDYDSSSSEGDGDGGVDIVAALLRYKWAVIVPVFVGALIGVAAWTQLPETYESASRLLVESDRPVVLDSSTGEMIKGVPGADVIQAQLFSDQVLRMAYFDDERFKAPELRQIIEEEFGSFGGFAVKCVDFEPETEGSNAATSLAFRLAVKHTSPELVNAASQALNRALIEYFEDRREDSIVKLRELIGSATTKYQPKLAELEKQHREFQRDNPLEFDVNGNAINPHRVKILELQQSRVGLEAQLNDLSSNLAIIEQVLKETEDTRTAIDVIGQYLNKELVTPIARMRKMGLADEDYDLKRLGFETQLVPLMVARQQAAAQFGEKHPSVVTLDDQIRYSKSEFEALSREWTDRMKAVMDDSELEVKQAKEAGVTIVTALRAQIVSLKTQLENLNSLIDRERREAEQLAIAEQENASLMREIEQAKGLLSTLKEQMARVNLADKQAGIVLTQLNSPSGARIVGPNLLLLLAAGIGVGLLCGGGLAYLLEAQAGTFRNAEEIATFLRVPVLSHIPFDPGRRSKLKKGETDPYEGLDDKLAIVHRPASLAAEAVRACRTAVFFEANSQGAKVIQVTSPLPSDGKTTLAGNLAASIAQAGKSVVIIDCDLRRPQISDNFALGEKEGLTNVLNGDCDPLTAIYQTAIKNLSVLPSGPIPLNPAEALTLPDMTDLLLWLRDRFDYVIVDTPPLLVVTDPSILASLVDGTVVTMKVRRKSKSNSREALNILKGVGANILGVVINASDDAAGSDGYKGYGYYKYSRYASKYNVGTGYRARGKQIGKNGKSTLLVGGRHKENGELRIGLSEPLSSKSVGPGSRSSGSPKANGSHRSGGVDVVGADDDA